VTEQPSEVVELSEDTTSDSIAHDSDAQFISEYGFSGSFDDSGEDIDGEFETLEDANQSNDDSLLFGSESGGDPVNIEGSGVGTGNEDKGGAIAEGLSHDSFGSDADEGMIGGEPSMDSDGNFGA
jgi:hypothetical protein